jgi:hypothetical protein
MLVGRVKTYLAGLALNHHFENLPVLGHVYPTGALGELDQGFIAVKSGYLWLNARPAIDMAILPRKTNAENYLSVIAHHSDGSL